MQKIFDRRYGIDVQLIGPGEYYVSKNKEIIVTTLGSCVSVCIYDPDIRSGGMNHFMLAESSGLGRNSSLSSGMYGINAMEEMINNLLSCGAKRTNLKAKVFGGANMFGKTESSAVTVGEQNIAFAKRYLIAEGIPIISEDTGQDHARKVYFDSATNKVKLHRIIGRDDREKITQEENSFKERIGQKKQEKKITFF